VGATAVAVPIFDPMGSPFVPIKTYLYVLGGMDDTGAVLASIERALVLSTNDAPRVTSIGASLTPGTLEAGTWYYKVSAILDAADPDNPGGETLPSDEQIITIGGAGGAIDLTWDPVMVNGMPAASYRIYRTDAVNGISQTEHVIATVSGTNYTDTGAAAGIEAPLPPGATGVWIVETGMLAAARWGHQTTLVTDTAGNLLLYAAGGKSDATTGYLGSVEYSLVSDVDGTLGAFGAGGVTDLPQGAAFFSIVVESPQNVSGYGGDGRLMALGGVVAGATTEDFLISDVTSGGGNGAWSPYPGAGGIQVRGGPMAVITSEKLFAFGGAASATDTTFSAIRTGIRDVGFLADGSLDSPIQSAADTLAPARALGVSVIGSGFIYLVGGTSDGDDALTSTVKTF
jgi:hypothetical protein